MSFPAQPAPCAHQRRERVRLAAIVADQRPALNPAAQRGGRRGLTGLRMMRFGALRRARDHAGEFAQQFDAALGFGEQRRQPEHQPAGGGKNRPENLLRDGRPAGDRHRPENNLGQPGGDQKFHHDPLLFDMPARAARAAARWAAGQDDAAAPPLQPSVAGRHPAEIVLLAALALATLHRPAFSAVTLKEPDMIHFRDAPAPNARIETDPVKLMAVAMRELSHTGRRVDRAALKERGFTSAEIDRHGSAAADLARMIERGFA